jgi:uncharacterized protein (TIGR03437 family)
MLPITRHFPLFCIVGLAGSFGVSATSVPPDDRQQRLKQSVLEARLRFEANQGQTDPRVKFVSRGPGYTMLLSGDGAILNLRGGPVRMTLRGASPSAAADGVDPLPGVSNYLVGNDRSKWRTGVQSFGRVRFHDVYPGIDLVYYGSQRQLEYDFVVSPGANPADIDLEFDGAERLSVDAAGDLVIDGPAGRMCEHRPAIYQQNGSQRTPVGGGYVVEPGNRARFRLAAYDRRRKLVIDPTLSYSTYFGGSGDDGIFDMAVDSKGYAYIGGVTGSADFPVDAGFGMGFQYSLNTGDTSHDLVTKVLPTAFGDGFIAKIAPDGKTLVYCTYLGGGSADGVDALAIDANGNVAVMGATASTDFPVTAGAYQQSIGKMDNMFVAELNAKGNGLIYSTYFGQSAAELDLSLEGNGIAIDSTGKIVIAGQTLQMTESPVDLPIKNAAQQAFGGGNMDAFVAKFDPTLRGDASLVFSTFLGGSGIDSALRAATDSSDNIYVRGGTCSSDFPVTATAYQSKRDWSCDVFLTEFSPAGKILYSTYLGGGSAEYGHDPSASYGPLKTLFGTGGNTTLEFFSSVFGGSYFGSGLAIDKNGFVYVTGATRSTDFPTTAGAYRSSNTDNSLTAFVAKLDLTKSGQAGLVYSTLIGPGRARSVAVDSSGVAYVVGETQDSGFPVTAGALQSTLGGGWDLFFSVIGTDGKSLLYSTYLGGSANEQGLFGIQLDPAGDVYIGAASQSTDFPVTKGALQTTNHGGWDGVLVKIDMGTLLTGPSISGVTNAASGAVGGVAPGEYVSIYGKNLGPAQGVVSPAASGEQKGLGGVTVLFGSTEAYLAYASASQLNVLVPYGVSGTNTTVEVEYNGEQGSTSVPVADVAPGIFTTGYGVGEAWVVNVQDYTWNSSTNAAAQGSWIEFWATGQGAVTPGGIDGSTIASGAWPLPTHPVTVVIGTEEVTPAWAGLIYTGEMQVNVQIPADAQAGGAVPLRLKIDGVLSRVEATVAIKAKQ